MTTPRTKRAPARGRGRGPSLPIDIVVKGVRIAKQSGTYDPKHRRRLVKMLKAFGDIDRTDILRAVRDGTLSLGDAWAQYRLGSLDKLPTPAMLEPLGAAWDKWLKTKPHLAPDTRADYAGARDRLLALDRAAMVADLPRLLERHHADSDEVRPRTFNQDWAAVRSFLGKRFGRFHELYAAVSRVERLPVTNHLPQHRLTPDQVRELAARLVAGSEVARAERRPGTRARGRAAYRVPLTHHAATLWGCCLSGMRPEEMFEERRGRKQNSWALETDRVAIRGTKGEASIRDVPRLAALTKPLGGRTAFTRALARVSAGMFPDGPVTPYDLRRTYSMWLDNAFIPNNRQDAYMAHGPQNMRELYRNPRQLAAWLAEDAAAISGVIGEITLPPSAAIAEARKRTGGRAGRGGLRIVA